MNWLSAIGEGEVVNVPPLATVVRENWIPILPVKTLVNDDGVAIIVLGQLRRTRYSITDRHLDSHARHFKNVAVICGIIAEWN